MTKKIYLWINFLPVALALLLMIAVLTIFRFLPYKLPLFYSLPWGEKQLANHTQFFIIPSIMILIALLNSAVSWQLHLTQSFFKKILFASSLIISLILLVTFIKIILIFL